MRIISLLLLLLTTATAAAQEKFVPCETETGIGYFYNDTDMSMDGCPTVEKALRLVKEDPLAYRWGDPDCSGRIVYHPVDDAGRGTPDCTLDVYDYNWERLNMAEEILRQGYAPVVVFSKEEQDALADELVQLYLHGTDEQAYLAKKALRDAGHKTHFDLLYEIVETLTAGRPDVLACLVTGGCYSTASKRVSWALSDISRCCDQKGHNYAAQIWAAGRKALEEPGMREAVERYMAQQQQN